MAYTLISSKIGSGQTTFTTTSVSTTGADLIVVARMTYQSNIATLSDSVTTSYSALTPRSIGGGVHTTLFYAYAPTTSGTHTWTLTGTGNIYSVVAAFAFSGSTASPFDVENGNTGAGFVNSAQPGSITPSENNELIVAAFGFNQVATLANADLDAINQINYSGGVNWGGGAGYKIQTTAAAINPNWTFSATMGDSLVVASFKAGAAAAQDTPELRGRPFGLHGQAQMHQLLSQ